MGNLVNLLLVLALTNLLPFGAWRQKEPQFYAAAYLFLLAAYVGLNIAPVWQKGTFTRLGIMRGGVTLMKLSAVSLTIYGVATVVYAFWLLPQRIPAGVFVLHIVLGILFCGLMAVNGYIRMYFTSVQLGIKWRVLLFLFWWVPIANLVLIWKACRLVRDEYTVEMEKAELNAVRKVNETCKTQYPLVLVHGVFFRDRKYFNYWGRIPGELIRNGATVFYGEQQSAASTAAAAAELKERILRVIEQTGCGKVNIIAHSKGGLEARYAVSRLGLAPYVASLTTINTPHRGCAFTDWLLNRVPKGICDWMAGRYNGALRKLGDSSPDFYAAVCDLTIKRCEEMNRVTPDVPDVFYQSVGSKMKGWTSAPFPLSFAYLLVRRFDRENDGLVGVDSMKWGKSFRLLVPPGRRGISHGDMIDLNRQNIRGFDVREFYVELVRNLRKYGY